jgi:hypothetical protein
MPSATRPLEDWNAVTVAKWIPLETVKILYPPKYKKVEQSMHSSDEIWGKDASKEGAERNTFTLPNYKVNYLKTNNFDTPDTYDSFSNTFGLKKKDISFEEFQTSMQDTSEMPKEYASEVPSTTTKAKPTLNTEIEKWYSDFSYLFRCRWSSFDVNFCFKYEHRKQT